MDAFLENSLFFFVDDAEPILPIFQSPEYGDPRRIVEVTDVGCDTETTYPVHFPRNAFHRRRGGAENCGPTRRIAEWRNERPSKFSRITTILNNKNRRRNYIEDKTRRNERDYDDVYVADLDYPYADSENPYDDFELAKHDSAIEYKDNYYTQFVNPRNIIGYSNQDELPRDARYNYIRNPDSSSARSNHVGRREKILTQQWFDESDERNFREDVDIRSPLSERRKRTKILSRTDENFNSKTEFEKCREQADENFPNAIDSKNNFWDSVSLENHASCEKLTFTEPTKVKNRNGLQRKTSFNIVDSEREEESEETWRKNGRQNLLPKMSTKSAKYQTYSKNNASKEKSKILQSNTINANSPRVKSARTSIDERTSNSTGKNSINVRPRSTVEGKKININSSEKRTETVNVTFAETRQPARMFKHIANSNSNERIYATNEEDNANPRFKNSGSNKIDRTNVTVSRSAAEEKKERTLTLKMTDVSSCTKIERMKRNFFSRLPIRTWKRLRTKEPTALRLETDITNGNDNRELQAADNVTAKLNDHLEKMKNDQVREKIRTADATTDCSDIKRSNRFGLGVLNADKPKIISSNIKNIKGLKDLNMTRKTSEQQKKRMNIK
ncbi:uncharacterized protein [Anoplolepis gracilipes]|uniref:uncharacterized protein n=1 Tax=Anoplolepis gracilipes TaxID=354296 RepID=UPI003BA265D4